MKPVEGQGSVPAADAVARTEHVWRAGAEAQAASRQAAEDAKRKRQERSVPKASRASQDAVHASGRDGRQGQGRRQSGRDGTRDGSPRRTAGFSDGGESGSRLDVRLD